MELNKVIIYTSKSHAERAMEYNFLTMLEHFPDLKNKYCVADHSDPVPNENKIYVGEDGKDMDQVQSDMLIVMMTFMIHWIRMQVIVMLM